MATKKGDARYKKYEQLRHAKRAAELAEKERLALEAPKPVAFGYGRVSTGKQEISIEAQQKQVEGYYNYRLQPIGLVWGGWYRDTAVSGKKPIKERKAGGALCERLRRGDHVILSRFDRGFRDAVDATVTLQHWQNMGITAHFLDMNVDGSTTFGKMLLTLCMYFAQIERERIGERTRQAQQHIRSTGHWLAGYSARHFGSDPPPGMKLVCPGHHKKLRRLEWVEEEMSLLRDLYDLKVNTGWSNGLIATALNENGTQRIRLEGEWTHGYVSRMLKQYRKYLADPEFPEYARPGKSNWSLTKPDTRFYLTRLRGTRGQPNSSTSASSATAQPSSPSGPSSVSPELTSSCELPTTTRTTNQETATPTLGLGITSNVTPPDTKPTATT
jgi:DNA invertase Pin-like site-specific DNA recombinase